MRDSSSSVSASEASLDSDDIVFVRLALLLSLLVFMLTCCFHECLRASLGFPL